MIVQTDVTRDLSVAAGRYRTQLGRFPAQHRLAIEAMAARSPRIAELAETFPGLLHALATARIPAEQRHIALLQVRSGAPLREIAELVGLPWWLRRLPPECFPPPGFDMPLDQIPAGEVLSLRIANLVPSNPAEAPAWLSRTLFAYRAAGEAYALWIARQRRFPAGVVGEITEALLAAWAWHGFNPDTPGHSLLLGIRWSETISLRRALEEAKAWSQRIDLAVALGTGIEDTWFPQATCNGHQFVPLRKLDDYLTEAMVMNNCLDQYADPVRQGRTRVFSIRKGERTIADVEIGMHDDDPTVPHIVQLRGPRNRRVGPEVWQATFAWLSGQTFRPLPRANETVERQRRQQLIRAIWRPMLTAVKGSGIDKHIQALAFGKEVSRSYRAFQTAPATPGPGQGGFAREAAEPMIALPVPSQRQAAD